MGYVLENFEEANRLELQATFNNYLLKDELKDLKIDAYEKVLDAGCGSGLLSRYLVTKFPNIYVTACDGSHQRLKQAIKMASQDGKYQNIQFLISKLESLEISSNSLDWVFCRFVLEHLPSPIQAVNEFYRVLKNQGKICLIDLDGILFNLFSENKELEGYLSILRNKWESDLYIGRRLPLLLKQAGFVNIHWKASLMQFHGQDLKDEWELTKQRLEFIKPTLLSHLETEERTNHFISLYLFEMQKPESTLFYNKFVVYADKQPLAN